MCIRVTCGYLILLGEETNDFWLVNLITRHELHFPNVPDEFFCCLGDVRVILVFSPSILGWVFVVINIYTIKIWFSLAGKQEWTHVSSPFYIHDLHVFKGKIYTINSILLSYQVRLCEMRLYPEPRLVVLETESLPKPNFRLPEFVSCGEKLYVINRVSKHPYKIHELDFDEMKLVSRKKTGQEYTFFLRDWKYHNPDVMQELWVDVSSQYGRYVVTDQCGKGKFFHASMWYFFHDFLMLISNMSDDLLARLS
ncbi:unnamed protein product [Lactuca virosa]|uniref:KIB1-4 beta-propeller domain-containing protein n=1 Tax=Lactuca virosa TaxID=75947 RepID=A0AAU9PJC1_9ASTR|nr:unnamed protein product [Lactuca virosa]